MGYLEVMQLPLTTFWFMNRSIDRIMAQSDMRAMTVARSVNFDSESSKSYREQLIVEAGTIVKVEEKLESLPNASRDESGFAELKMMAGQKIGL